MGGASVGYGAAINGGAMPQGMMMPTAAVG